MSMSGSEQEKVGQVSLSRYQELVARIVKNERVLTRSQFDSGDAALEIEPMHTRGGSAATEELFSVEASMRRLSDDTGIPVSTLKTRRWVSSRWPVERRREHVSWKVHQILADESDEQRRWKMIDAPPRNERTGRLEWTEDAARREVGQKVQHPVTVTEKVKAIHDMAADETVASRAVTDLLRRPEVAFHAMSDDVTRHLVNRAQVDRSQQAVRAHRQSAAPALERIQQARGFLDLVAACSAFVSAIGRTMPTLAGHAFTPDERTVVHAHVAKVRATADWVESVVETGNLSLDEGLAALLRGE